MPGDRLSFDRGASWAPQNHLPRDHVEEIRLTWGRRAFAFLVALGLTNIAASAQAPPPSGKMWLLEEPPLEHIDEVYGVEITEEWLEKARLSGLRYGGGSASFVSPNGLVMTNHHVVRGDLSRIEHEGKNLGLHGYVARSREEELPIPGASVRQLVHVEDVTHAVFAGVDLMAPIEQVNVALAKNRQAVLAQARSASPGRVVELVTLLPRRARPPVLLQELCRRPYRLCPRARRRLLRRRHRQLPLPALRTRLFPVSRLRKRRAARLERLSLHMV